MGDSGLDDKKQELLSGAIAIPISQFSDDSNMDGPRLESDASGIQLHVWSHPLKDAANDRCGTPRECRYSFLSCFPMAQIESRLGIASYNASMVFYCVLMTLNVAFTLLLALCLEWLWMYIDVLPLVVICVVSLLLMLVLSGLLKIRIMAARRHIRERFGIPGDDVDDRTAVNWHEGQAIRQMARHLHCDGTKLMEKMETLPAYPLH